MNIFWFFIIAVVISVSHLGSSKYKHGKVIKQVGRE